MTHNEQHEIDAQIELAMQTKMRFGYTTPAVINKLWINRHRFIIGFNFMQNAKVGKSYINADGTRCEVLAIV